MRILLINQYAGSPKMGMEYRPHWMATEWQRLGHEVLVVTADWTHLRRSQPPIRHGTAEIEGVLFRVLPVPRHRGNGVLRFANMAAFSATLGLSSRGLIGWRPEVVIASSTHPLDVRPAADIANRSGAQFVHEVHDLWPLTPMLLGGMSASHPMVRLMQNSEDFACRRADRVVSILPATKEYLVGRGLDPSKWTHIPNGVPRTSLTPGSTDAAESGSLRVGYFGGHGPSNDVETLIAAARHLRDEPVEFHLTGSGSRKADLMAGAESIPAVQFHDEVTPQEARQRMRQMDVLWWGVKESRLYEQGLGLNKVFDYMASGIPLVGNSNYLGPSTGVGCEKTVPAGDSAATAMALRSIAAMTRIERRRMGALGRDFVTQGATQDRLAARFLAEVGAGSADVPSTRADGPPPCRV